MPKSDTPVVSVLIPVYKGERFVARAIRSILEQSLLQTEVIIVNDGSPDASFEAIKPYLCDSRLKYLEQENAGVAAARNSALRVATGKYIGLCDQDDEWLPHKAEVQVAYLEAHPDFAMVHGDVNYIDESGNLLPHDAYFPSAVSGDCFPRMFMGNPVMAVAALFRRSVIDEVGGFDPEIKYADDYDLWLRIAVNHKIGFIDEPLARYRLHENNNSHDQIAIREFTLQVLRKIERQHPEACARIAPEERRRRYSNLYERMAEYVRAESQPIAALAYAARAVLYDPVRVTCSAVPANVRNLVAWYWARLKRTIS